MLERFLTVQGLVEYNRYIILSASRPICPNSQATNCGQRMELRR
jgi:hypothetical protein